MVDIMFLSVFFKPKGCCTDFDEIFMGPISKRQVKTASVDSQKDVKNNRINKTTPLFISLLARLDI